MNSDFKGLRLDYVSQLGRIGHVNLTGNAKKYSIPLMSEIGFQYRYTFDLTLKKVKFKILLKKKMQL
jgi:hypothetical protein